MDHFELKPYIRFNTKVLSCRQPEGSKTWQVVYQKQGSDEPPVEETFDAVIACSGHLSHPLIPEFEGIDMFKGEIFHSHVYRNPARFEGKKVAIIGFGNSAADISCEISTVAKEVHLITRRGGWVIPRYVLGKPAEAYDSKLCVFLCPGKASP